MYPSVRIQRRRRLSDERELRRFFADQAILDQIQRAVGEKRQADRAAGVKVAYTSRR